MRGNTAMLEIQYPYFNKGRILKKEMLENLRDFPRNILEVQYEDFTDGILCGFTPSIDKNMITFSKGITKYNDMLYVIPEPVFVQYNEAETDVMIKLNFYDEIQDKDYKTVYIDIEIEDNMKLLDNQQELGRFKLKRGAYLRSQYKDFYDFTTEYNTINIVHALYAARGKKTISSIILQYFARAVLNLKAQNPIDISFCFICLNSERIEREVILQYLSYKLEKEIIDLSNIEIHTELTKILEQIKRESSFSNKKKIVRNKIFVD